MRKTSIKKNSEFAASQFPSMAAISRGSGRWSYRLTIPVCITSTCVSSGWPSNVAASASLRVVTTCKRTQRGIPGASDKCVKIKLDDFDLRFLVFHMRSSSRQIRQLKIHNGYHKAIYNNLLLLYSRFEPLSTHFLLFQFVLWSIFGISILSYA